MYFHCVSFTFPQVQTSNGGDWLECSEGAELVSLLQDLADSSRYFEFFCPFPLYACLYSLYSCDTASPTQSLNNIYHIYISYKNIIQSFITYSFRIYGRNQTIASPAMSTYQSSPIGTGWRVSL